MPRASAPRLPGSAAANYFKKPSDYSEFMKLGSLAKELLELPPAGDAD